MFERLDPAEPFRPDEQFRAAVVERGRRLRRRRHRLAGAALGSVVVVVGAVGVLGAWAQGRWDDIQKVEVNQLPVDVDPIGGDPFNILVVGVDGPRVDLSPASAGQRADSIMVVRVEPATGRVQVVSIPRDLWVPISGHGEQRINSALPLGGPALLVGTVESSLGIPVDRYLQVDFDGFRDLVDAAGGVRLDLATPLRDETTGLDAPAGCQTFNGSEALALVRSRHAERLVDGAWRPSLTGDFGRMLRQQAFGRAVLAAVGDIGSSPRERASLLDLFARHVTIDSHWTREQMEGLAEFATELGPDDVSSRILPVTEARRGEAQVLLPEGEALDGVLASLRGEAPDPRPGAAETPQTGPDLGPC